MAGRLQTIIWRLEVLSYDVVRLVLRLFPLAAVSWFGGWLLRKIGPKTSKHKIAKTGVELAFPSLSPSERDALLMAQWDNIGRTFAEFPLLHRVVIADPKSAVTVSGLDIFKANAPAVIVTGHFANWEIMAAVLTQSGLPVRITYRKLNNPYMDARIKTQREKYGTKFLVQKSGVRGGRELFEALNHQESVALLNDQKFNEGISVPFFGHNAMTATGATRLALKTGRPLLPLSVTRDGSRFHVTFHDPIPLSATGQREVDVRRGVMKIIDFTEAQIRNAPDQWFWVHRRWPKPLYKSGAKTANKDGSGTAP